MDVPIQLSIALLAVIFGAFTFALGHIIVKFFVEPIQQLREVIGKIADSLLFYENIYLMPGTPPPENLLEASIHFRTIANLLMSKAQVIIWYHFPSFCRLVPKVEDLKKAYLELLLISKRVMERNTALENKKSKENIQKYLGLNRYF